MNKKGKLAIIIVAAAIILFGVIYFFTNEDKNNSLTIIEKKWIENNKNKVIDLAVLNGVPIVNYNGSGLFFDFLNSLEKDTGLEFNKLSYNKGTKVSSEYSLDIKDEVTNDILFYQDNYVIVTKDKVHYNDVTELKNLSIGTLNSDLTKVNTYLAGSINLTYKGYDSESEMIDDVKAGNISGIVLPKLDYLESILDNDLNIAYNITEYSKNYVLTLGSNKRLNKILTKYFNNYKKSKYQKSLNKYLADTYFSFNNIDEKEQTNFRSKRYNYGFVLEAPFEVMVNGSLKGFNYSFIKEFADMANVEVDFKRYSSLENELNDFNNNDLDLISSDVNASSFKMDVYNTVPVYNNKVAVITNGDKILTANNVSALKNIEVSVVKNSKFHGYLSRNGIKVKEYNNVKSLIDDLKDDDVAVIDEYIYDYYVRSELKDVKKIKTLDFDEDYGFIARDINANKVFNEFLNFYLSFVNTNGVVNESYNDILSLNNNIILLQTILSALLIILISFSLILAVRVFKRRKTYDFKLSKADKLRYIDSMTSLKNRDYLNDNIAKWDNSQIYPQAVIIVDLNNVAYINDNFGHAEGDKVIIEGASVLINNQLSDSELVRTNGNEFLVFTIGHDEKTIVTYMRKLNKEFKELSHGFGAAIGYSMINDEIKTIDDAINEATIDMRNNKEEINN